MLASRFRIHHSSTPIEDERTQEEIDKSSTGARLGSLERPAVPGWEVSGSQVAIPSSYITWRMRGNLTTCVSGGDQPPLASE